MRATAIKILFLKNINSSNTISSTTPHIIPEIMITTCDAKFFQRNPWKYPRIFIMQPLQNLPRVNQVYCKLYQ